MHRRSTRNDILHFENVRQMMLGTRAIACNFKTNYVISEVSSERCTALPQELIYYLFTSFARSGLVGIRGCMNEHRQRDLMSGFIEIEDIVMTLVR